jgi:hypothetical protein
MNDQPWGLIACARSEDVELSVDESIATPTVYEMTISLRSIELRISIRALEDVSTFKQFLLDHCKRSVFAEMRIGTLLGVPIRIVKDSEFVDRFYLRATGIGMIEVILVDPISQDLVNAAVQLVADISSL